jgi:hypothetical protein
MQGGEARSLNGGDAPIKWSNNKVTDAIEHKRNNRGELFKYVLDTLAARFIEGANGALYHDLEALVWDEQTAAQTHTVADRRADFLLRKLVKAANFHHLASKVLVENVCDARAAEQITSGDLGQG